MHLQRIQSEFSLEYGLIKEYMSVNQAGFTLLECRITQSHAISMSTVLAPSLLRHVIGHVDWGGAVNFGPGTTGRNLLIFIISMMALIESTRSSVASGYEGIMARFSHILKGIQNQTSLAVVVVAMMIRMAKGAF